jgi:hypothetical protein
MYTLYTVGLWLLPKAEAIISPVLVYFMTSVTNHLLQSRLCTHLFILSVFHDICHEPFVSIGIGYTFVYSDGFLTSKMSSLICFSHLLKLL